MISNAAVYSTASSKNKLVTYNNKQKHAMVLSVFHSSSSPQLSARGPFQRGAANNY